MRKERRVQGAMTKRQKFEKPYYDRYYHNPRTRVTTARETQLLGTFVCAYLRYLEQPIRRVLDVGCGLGHWERVIANEFPRARYEGVEKSEYLCEKYGWIPGSVVNYETVRPYDLVICQDVMQYLPDKDASIAIVNLVKLCRGAVYLEFPTDKDWQNVCDRKRSDNKIYLRSANWYRRRLKQYFVNLGGGLLVPVDSPLMIYELQSTIL